MPYATKLMYHKCQKKMQEGQCLCWVHDFDKVLVHFRIEPLMNYMIHQQCSVVQIVHVW